jgi:hypothetical protein
MNGRERIEAAFSPEGTPEIGAVIPYESIFIRDHWEDLSDKPWWVRVSPDDNIQFTWRGEVARKIRQDWFDLPTGISKVDQENLSIEIHNTTVYLVDRRYNISRKLTPPKISGWPDYDNASIHPVNPPDTPEDIDVWMENWTVPGQGLASDYSDLPEKILSDWGKEYYPMGYINGPLWSCYYMWGFEGLMTRIIHKPDLVQHAVKRFTESTLKEINVYASIGVLGLWLEDCMTDMVSHHMFHRFNLPYLRIITDSSRAKSIRTFHYFCGNPAGKWQDLLDSGADALSLEESKKGFEIDIVAVAEMVNRHMVLLGNLDAVDVLEQADEQRLQYEITRQLQAGKMNGNRFIMSLGSPVTPGTSVERVQLYLNIAHSLKDNIKTW